MIFDWNAGCLVAVSLSYPPVKEPVLTPVCLSPPTALCITFP